MALAAGLIAAWWQSSHAAEERQLVLLLTHVEARLGTVALDRHELTKVAMLLEPGRVQTLHFRAGNAPEATDAIQVTTLANARKLTLRCRFTLPSGAEIRTTGEAVLPDASDDVQVIDIGACGTVEP